MNRRPVVVGLGGAVAVLLAWYAFFWSPQSDALRTQRADAASAGKRLDAVRSAAQRQRSGAKDEPAQRAQLVALKTAIPDTTDVAVFILQANDAAARAGVVLVSVAPRAAGTGTKGATVTPTPAGLAATPLTLTAQGPYAAVVDFIDRVEHLPRLVLVDGLTASATNGGERINVTLTARMFSTSAKAAS